MTGKTPRFVSVRQEELNGDMLPMKEVCQLSNDNRAWSHTDILRHVASTFRAFARDLLKVGKISAPVTRFSFMYLLCLGLDRHLRVVID